MLEPGGGAGSSCSFLFLDFRGYRMFGMYQEINVLSLDYHSIDSIWGQKCKEEGTAEKPV